VTLDPQNSLLRSYLGKAYFDERTTDPVTYFEQLVENFPNQENTLAAEQFAIAKELDPKDPTPWLYDAIRLQSENRPVEALHDIEKSIELNDNRAIYRSRELLDQDRAARGTSLARIYNDLGFQQLGINEATKSLSYDPGNAGAHRFLSDVYAPQPRREIARASELLQAQLLQDININPVQPSLSETDLNIITGGGPARPGFNEFTPLFERNQAQLDVAGLVGNDWTRGEEAVVSGIYDNVSVSAGQFHYQSDGFRENFHVQHNVYNLFAQAAITPEFNVQAEYRKRYSEEGNLAFNFDSGVFSEDTRVDIDQDTARFGARYSPNALSDLLASFIYTNRHLKAQDAGSDNRVHQSGIQAESQYLFRLERTNGLVGASFIDVDHDEELVEEEDGEILVAPDLKFPSRQNSVYAYTNVLAPYAVTFTLGLSFEDFKEEGTDHHYLAPKFGVRWQATPYLVLRAAVFRTIKSTLLANQTLQPTEIAGFNQLWDDANGSRAATYALGAEAKISRDVQIGAEFYKRDVDSPIRSDVGSFTIDFDEDVYRGYLYWTIASDWAVTTEIRHDRFRAGDENAPPIAPKQLNTTSFPLTISYFAPAGYFGTLAGTFVDQDVFKTGPQDIFPEGHDRFFVLDATLGYRLPRRYGMFSVQGRNLLNERLKYQDDSFRSLGSQRTQISPFIPERAFFAQMTLNF
jgi:hypothetical protein